MALGKIKADTLEHSTAGSLDTKFVVQGSAKAWLNINQTSTQAIRDSFNISSDLLELSKTPVGVICAGVKLIQDIPKTLEYLETCLLYTSDAADE